MAKPLTKNSKRILADLFRARRPLSVKKIAERNEVAWQTAKDNIERLEKKGLVKCKFNPKKKSKHRKCEITPKARSELEN